MDDLYAGWDGLAASVATLVTDVLQPLHAGRSGRYRRYDWHLEQFTEQVTVPARQFLVVEGCGSSVGAAGVLSDVRVWLDAPAQARRERALARADDGFAEHWDTWAAAEDDLFEADDTAAHAQLRLETGC